MGVEMNKNPIRTTCTEGEWGAEKNKISVRNTYTEAPFN